jgi:apolipoprotein N-acyltransferase
MLQEVPLSDTVTPAHALGRTLEWGIILFALSTITLGAALSRRQRA